MKHELPENDFFTQNRAAFMEKMKPNSLAIFQSAQPKYRNADNLYKFKQESNYFYLTGVEVPKSALILYPDAEEEKKKEILFIEKPNPKIEEWTGKRMTKEEAKELTGIEEVKFMKDLEKTLFKYLWKIENLYVIHRALNIDEPLNNEIQFINKIRDRYPALNIIRANNIIAEHRLIKNETEISYIKHAIQNTKKGLLNAMKSVKPGMREFELQSIIEKEYLDNYSERVGFSTIVASGGNACVLHYIKNESVIEENDLVLIDTGAEYANYSADITRTFPASGEFTDRQREVYQKVLDTQLTIIDMVKPGITLKELKDKTKEILTQNCKDLGLEKETDDEYFVYIKHGVGHYLGLDTHDVFTPKKKELEPGNVITIEPGLYISEENIGIRIEDDVLVTEDGYEVLSSDIPKDISELEEIIG